MTPTSPCACRPRRSEMRSDARFKCSPAGEPPGEEPASDARSADSRTSPVIDPLDSTHHRQSGKLPSHHRTVGQDTPPPIIWYLRSIQFPGCHQAISIGAADFEVLLRGRVRSVPVRCRIRDALSFLGFHSPPRSAPHRLVLPSPAGGPRGSTSRDARRDRALRGESREARPTKSPLPLVCAPESDDFERGLFGVWRGGSFARASPTAGIHRPS
jgi:hypothetical protein